jgi:hypothetical protein
MYVISIKPAVKAVAVRVNAVVVSKQSLFVIRVRVAGVTQSTLLAAIRKRGNPGKNYIIQIQPAASVEFLKGRSYAINGDIAQRQDVITWRYARVLTPLFRKVFVLILCGLIAKTVLELASGRTTPGPVTDV